jgi:anti-sigma B factor antagonist
MAEALEVRSTVSADGTWLVALAGEMDVATSGQLVEALEALVETHAGTRATLRVVVDVSSVTFLDSSGISTLLVSRRLLADHHGALLLRHPPPGFYRTLELAGLTATFDIER